MNLISFFLENNLNQRKTLMLAPENRTQVQNFLKSVAYGKKFLNG